MDEARDIKINGASPRPKELERCLYLSRENYPAYDVLKQKNVFVMNGDRGENQVIRPIKIGLLNLMPTLEVTETQLIKMLANTPLQVDLNLIMMDTDYRKKEDLSHLNQFYHSFDEMKDEKFDGMIITGAPLEMLDFEEVDYWGRAYRDHG